MTKKELIAAIENMPDDVQIEVMFGINHYHVSGCLRFSDAILLRSKELDEIFDSEDEEDEEEDN